VLQSIQAILNGTPFVMNEHRAVLPNGEIRWQQWTDRAIFNHQGELIEIQGVGRDVTDRKQAEDSLRASLREKEVLLKEVHHRVKNNLQMVSSLLSLQSGITQSDELTGAFTESQRRIKVMALVHEKLYRSENLDQIDFSDYVQELVYDLFQSYTSAASEITLTMDIARVDFNVDTAVTCGLIINELVSNAVKYAFPDGHSGTISISFIVIDRELSRQTIDNDLSIFSYNPPSGMQYRLVVGDSGVGIPGEIDYRNTESLGLQLVCALTQELDGIVELDRSAGTKFTIWF
jgi:two-component sensor histidine kinase